MPRPRTHTHALAAVSSVTHSKRSHSHTDTVAFQRFTHLATQRNSGTSPFRGSSKQHHIPTDVKTKLWQRFDRLTAVSECERACCGLLGWIFRFFVWNKRKQTNNSLLLNARSAARAAKRVKIIKLFLFVICTWLITAHRFSVWNVFIFLGIIV